MRSLIYWLVAAFLLSSCGEASERAKEAIKDGGEIVGETVGEFGKGVAEGWEEALQIKIILSDSLIEAGIELGKINVENLEGGTDNVLVVYMIFTKDFNHDISARAFDTNDLEIGRTTSTVEGKAGEAGYFEFQFDKRTNIDNNGKITMK